MNTEILQKSSHCRKSLQHLWNVVKTLGKANYVNTDQFNTAHLENVCAVL